KEPSIAGLVRHRGRAAGAVDPSLRFAGDPAGPMSLRAYGRYKLERRLFLGTLAHRIRPALLHLPDPYGTPFDMRVPRIATCHDLIPLLFYRDYLAPIPGARAIQLARDYARYRTVKRVIAVSECTKRDLVEHVGVAPDRIDVVYHGVDHQLFDDREQPSDADEVARVLGFRDPFLLYLGAGDARKNLPLLVQAFARSGLAPDIKLVLAGPLAPRQRQRLDAAIARAGTQAHVVGYVEGRSVPALYRRCLAHVFPSSYEGFGLPLLEAMACGAPTLTTDCASLPEVAADAALTVPLEIDALASALQRMVADGELRASLRRRGIARAHEFTWERCAEQTVRSYERALSS
ncbi:MAG TPA: glycosyltransferase family 1 protein, partial [Polyangiaceae bacterium]|nr:glycosyltransferase family 1 protein [Polyangiaceae bacterium]